MVPLSQPASGEKLQILMSVPLTEIRQNDHSYGKPRPLFFIVQVESEYQLVPEIITSGTSVTSGSSTSLPPSTRSVQVSLARGPVLWKVEGIFVSSCELLSLWASSEDLSDIKDAARDL